ncbi:MAG: TatD family hydrolase [Bacteroidales bacterium]|nr:TatD family hydrolase [Bacteroidales bacterium]
MRYVDIHRHPPLSGDNDDVISIVDISSPDAHTCVKTLCFRHCERSEAIQSVDAQWVASGYRPRNDVATHFSHRLAHADLQSVRPVCSYGIHPWFLTAENADQQLFQLEHLLQHDAIVAIGEVGLDAVRGAGMEAQQRVFEKVISLSEQYQKPLIIHCVKAWDKLLSLHKNRKATQTWIVHGFQGNYELASQLLNRKMRLSFGTKLLKDDRLQTVFSRIPIDSLFLETDDAEVDIADVYLAAAAIRKMEMESLKHVVFENFTSMSLILSSASPRG